MRFSVLIEIYCGFAVLDNFLCGFSVSNKPQCPPHEANMAAGHVSENALFYKEIYIP